MSTSWVAVKWIRTVSELALPLVQCPLWGQPRQCSCYIWLQVAWTLIPTNLNSYGTLGWIPMKMQPELVDAWVQQHPQGLRIFSIALDCHLQPINSSWIWNVLANHPEEEVPRSGGWEPLLPSSVFFFNLLKYNWFSAKKQRLSFTHIDILFIYILFHYGLLQDIEYKPPCRTVGLDCYPSSYI